jgi:hypothetical protein
MTEIQNPKLRPQASSPQTARPLAGAIVALFALVLLALLAFDPFRLVEAAPSEKLTLLFMAICSGIAVFSPLRRHFRSLEAATFLFTASWVVLYALARRAGPAEGWSFHLAAEPEVSFTLSYAARIAIAGALVAAAIGRAALSGFTRAALLAMLVAGLLLLGNFLFLAQFFSVGETKQLDPVPLAHALLQLVEYGAIAVLCGVAASDARVRGGLLKVLPILLLALWARYQFGPIPVEEDEE